MRRRGRIFVSANCDKEQVESAHLSSLEASQNRVETSQCFLLPPLRDARQALGSGAPTRIASLLKSFLLDGEEAGFLDHVRRAQAQHRVVTEVNMQIGDALRNLTQGVRTQATSLDFTAAAGATRPPSLWPIRPILLPSMSLRVLR